MGKLNRLFIFIMSCIFFGCASIPNANEKNQTLIVGQIVLEAIGWPAASSNINGIHKTGIEITILNRESGKKYSVKSNNDGLFYLNNIPAGKYRISRLYFNKPSWKGQRGPGCAPYYYFNVIEGSVNNFGLLHWYSTRYYNNLNRSKDYEQVRKNIQEKYKLKNLNEKEWVKI